MPAARTAKTTENAASSRLATGSETAEYIADLLNQLERLAATAGLVKLQYLILAARDEAREATGPGRV